MFDSDDDGFLFDPRRFERNGAFLVPGRDWEVETPPQPLTFFAIVRGISRLGLLFSIGLTTTLAARLIPGVLPGYLLLLGISATGCVIYASLSRRTSERIIALMFGAIVLFGVIGGSWDAIYGSLADSTGQKTGIQISIVGAVFMLTVGASLMFQRGRNQ